MEELKKQVINQINELNQKWVQKISDGEKDGIDLTEMFGEFSEIIKKIDLAFQEAAARRKGKKKGFF